MTIEPAKLARVESCYAAYHGMADKTHDLGIYVGNRAIATGNNLGIKALNDACDHINAAVSALLQSERAKVWEEAAKIVSDLGDEMNFEQI